MRFEFCFNMYIYTGNVEDSLIPFDERIFSRYFVCKLSKMRAMEEPMDKEEPPLWPIYGQAGGWHPVFARHFLAFRLTCIVLGRFDLSRMYILFIGNYGLYVISKFGFIFLSLIMWFIVISIIGLENSKFVCKKYTVTINS